MSEQVEGVRSLNHLVQINEGRIQAHWDEVVRNTVEETLNALLDAEAAPVLHSTHAAFSVR